LSYLKQRLMEKDEIAYSKIELYFPDGGVNPI
jgi:hypothetical protein